MDMTSRQIRLFYNAAIRKENQQSAMRIREVNAGFAGGDDAQRLIDELMNVRGD